MGSTYCSVSPRHPCSQGPCPAGTGLALSELRRGIPGGRCSAARRCGLLPEPRHLLPPLTPVPNTSLSFLDSGHPVPRRPAPDPSVTGPQRVPRLETSGAWTPTPFRGAPGTTSNLQPEKPAGAWLWLRAPGAGSGGAEGLSALGGGGWQGRGHLGFWWGQCLGSAAENRYPKGKG